MIWNARRIFTQRGSTVQRQYQKHARHSTVDKNGLKMPSENAFYKVNHKWGANYKACDIQGVRVARSARNKECALQCVPCACKKTCALKGVPVQKSTRWLLNKTEFARILPSVQKSFLRDSFPSVVLKRKDINIFLSILPIAKKSACQNSLLCARQNAAQ